jgi:hypothetical protein
MLINIDDAKKIINSGKWVSIAGDEKLLRQLPEGNWIGGTIPYFMDETGGVTTRDKLFVFEMPEFISHAKIQWYDQNNLNQIPEDSPDNGFTIIIIPSASQVHLKYAQEAPDYPSLFLKQIIGWISGIHLDDLGKASAQVVNGTAREFSGNKVIGMHVSLPESKYATIGIMNLFNQGDGDTLTFAEDGFNISDCFVNGVKCNFYDYLSDNKIDLKYPLVADYSGTMINASFQNTDAKTKTVDLYAPVFAGIKYKLAAPMTDYVKEFDSLVPPELGNVVFSCNCILNYLYSELEGKKTKGLTGPVTFGEIAYQLVNQTLAYLEIKNN